MREPAPERPHMPDYGVDESGWEGLPWSWAAERLRRGHNYWLTTVSGAGRPHSMPVWGVWNDEEQRFAVSCAPGARKARNLDENPRVVIAGDDTIECVSVEGLADRVPAGERAEQWIERYIDKYRPVAPTLSADFLRLNLVFEITPDRVFAVIERDDEFSTRATRWTF